MRHVWIDHEWVPIDQVKRPRRSAGVQLIRDLEPYQAVAADKATGKAPVIGGRRQHREFLRRNGYAEVGNEYVPLRRELGPRPGEVARDIKRALGE